MTEVLVGTTLPQFTDDPDRLVNGARRAEELGLDSIWVFDHLWPLTGGKERPIFECWTSLALVAAETESIRIGTLVARSSLRNPAVLAKMAATVADVAPGRLTVAIGSGDEMSRDENEAYGIPYYADADRIAQLVSTVRCVKECLHADGPVDFSDEYVSLEGFELTPVPDSPPAVWVGGRADDVLELAAVVADGWNGWGGTPKRFAQDAATVAELAKGRPVELSWGGLVRLDVDDASAIERMGDRSHKGWIVGGPETVASRLSGFVDAGARHVICTFPDPSRPEVYELLAREVKPRLNG